jgi:putative transport protein
MVLAAILGLWLFRFNMLTLLGALTGGMTSTPGLAAVTPMTDTDAPSVAYAAVYPVALVVLIICAQILGRL